MIRQQLATIFPGRWAQIGASGIPVANQDLTKFASPVQTDPKQPPSWYSYRGSYPTLAQKSINGLSNRMEGANGATFSINDSNPDPFDAFVSGATVTRTYDTSVILSPRGTASLKLAISGGFYRFSYGDTNNLNTVFSHQSEYYARAFYQFDTLPTAFFAFFYGVTYSSFTDSFRAGVNSAGKFEIRDTANTPVATSTMTLSVNTPYRFELHIDHITETITVQIYQGANSNGVTPDETLTAGPGGNFAPVYHTDGQIFFGVANSGTASANVWVDDITVRDAVFGWIGPVPVIPIVVGAISATSTVSGAVGKLKGVLPATVNATSTVAGSLRVIRRIAPGAISATSTLSGNVVARRAITPAQVLATSTVSGRVNKLARIAGAVAATSTVSGSIRVIRRIAPGAVSATSTVSGSVFKGAFRQISGAVSATSTVSGSLRVIRRIAPTTIQATSTLSGSVVARRRILPGAISATSAVSGSVSVFRAVRPATVSATSTLTGRVSKLAAISGLVSATSTVLGSLRAIRGVGGVVSATSTVSGSVKVITPIIPGQISSISAVSGSVTARRRILPGQILATSTVTGNLVRPIRHIAGVISATSTVTGSVRTKHAVSGVIVAQSTVSGKIVRVVHPFGVINATSTLSGNIVTQRRISGIIFATSQVSATLRVGRIIYGRTARLVSAEYEPAELLRAGDEIPTLVSVK